MTAAPDQPAVHADAALLQLCADFMVQNADYVAINDGILEERVGADAYEGHADRCHNAWWGLLRVIVETPALTMEGIVAKAPVLKAAISGIDIVMTEWTIDDMNESTRLAWNLVEDILRLLAAGVEVPVAAKPGRDLCGGRPATGVPTR